MHIPLTTLLPTLHAHVCTCACASACVVCTYSEFEARPVDSEVATQPLLPEPRTVTAHYAAGDSEDGDGKVGQLQQQLQAGRSGFRGITLIEVQDCGSCL